MTATRPEIKGTRHMAAACHYLAAEAAFQILEAGGNAVDAGVAGGLALGVVQSDLVSVAGVAPIMIRMADSREVITISGLGTWPMAASAETFRREHGGKLPLGILRCVVPAAPDAWITALERYGTMSFGEVAASAIRFARDGYPLHALMAEIIADKINNYRRWPANAAIYLPGGRPPAAYELFVQSDLGRSLQFMADQEKAAAGKGRKAGLAAARDAFYRGDIADRIVAYHRENGGLMTADDLAGFKVGIEPPVRARFRDTEVFACGPWCQGPSLPQLLKLVEGVDLAAMGHNSPAYIHTLTEAIKLVFADREAYIGDPRFVDVPIRALLSADYAAIRRRAIDPNRAAPGMPAPGAFRDLGIEPRPLPASFAASPADAPIALDTSYVCVIDALGNVFSATPSDGSYSGPVIPGLGFVASTRGSQNWTDPDHPSCLEPGKRPRLTPNPAMAVGDDGSLMPFGTPGGDVQVQAMAQVFLNMKLFGMEPQAAIDAPRFASYSFPGSFEPHEYFPGRLNLEGRIAAETGADLDARGHKVEWWPDTVWLAGAVCAVSADRKTGILSGGADIRRPGAAVGW